MHPLDKVKSLKIRFLLDKSMESTQKQWLSQQKIKKQTKT